MSRRLKRSFRVYPDNGEVYYEVRIYKSKAKLQKAVQWPDAIGFCQYWTTLKITKKGKSILRPCIGRISFCDTKAGCAVIAHECTHAAWKYFEWRKENHLPVKYGGVDEDNSREETFCRVVSTLVKQVINNYRRHEPVGYHEFPANKVVLKK